MKEPKYRTMNKRGNIILDMGVFAIILFVLLLVMFVVNLFWSNLYDDVLTQDSDFAATAAVNSTYENMDGWINSWGFIFFFVVAGVLAFMVLAAQMVDTHPGFYIIAIFALIFLVILVAYLSNAFDEFSNDASFTEQKSEYALASNVILYLPIFILLLGGIVIVILYSKT